MRRFLLVFLIIFSTAARGAAPLSLATPHFIIDGGGFSDAYVRRAADSAEGSLARIEKTLGAAPDSAITIVFAPTDARFRELTAGTLPDWSAAAALPGRRIVFTPLAGMKIEMERILAHEIVHIVIDDAAGGREVPRWFHEGCAQLLSGEWTVRNDFYMSWMVVRGNLLSFGDIQDVFSRGSLDAGLAYDQSMLAVRRLMGLCGGRALPRILEGMKKGREFPDAFHDATGYTIPEFEKEYLSFLDGRYGIRSLFTLIPGTWTLIGLLFLVVYLVKRARAKRKLAEWAAGGRAPERELTIAGDVSEDDDDVPGDDAEEMFDEFGEPYEEPPNTVRFTPRPGKYGGGGGGSG